MNVLPGGGMMNRAQNAFEPKDSIFRGVMLAYFVLFLHVVLIFGMGALLFFFGGVIAYLPWILASAGTLVVGSAYLCWKHMKKSGKNLRQFLEDPIFQGRTVEVSLLGGFASLKLGHSQGPLTIPHVNYETPKQLQDPRVVLSEELVKLARLLKQDIITIDEFLKAKKKLIDQ